jgi:hypothetical protein
MDSAGDEVREDSAEEINDDIEKEQRMSNKPAIIVGMESVLAIVQAIDQTAEHP